MAKYLFVLSLMVLVGCGAVEPTVTVQLDEPMLGCSVTPPDTNGASCTFAAAPGRAYYAEAKGDVVPALVVVLCDEAGCRLVDREFVPGLITIQIPRQTKAGLVKVTFGHLGSGPDL